MGKQSSPIPLALLPKGPSNPSQTLRAKGPILLQLQQAQRAQRKRRRGPVRVNRSRTPTPARTPIEVQGLNCTDGEPGLWSTTRSRPSTAQPFRRKQMQTFSLRSQSCENFSSKANSCESFYVGNGFTGHKRPLLFSSASTDNLDMVESYLERYDRVLSQTHLNLSSGGLHRRESAENLHDYYDYNANERLRVPRGLLTPNAHSLKSASTPNFSTYETFEPPDDKDKDPIAPANSPEPPQGDVFKYDMFNARCRDSNSNNLRNTVNKGSGSIHKHGFPDIIEVSGCLFAF